MEGRMGRRRDKREEELEEKKGFFWEGLMMLR